jgi:hypothetical protein
MVGDTHVVLPVPLPKFVREELHDVLPGPPALDVGHKLKEVGPDQPPPCKRLHPCQGTAHCWHRAICEEELSALSPCVW